MIDELTLSLRDKEDEEQIADAAREEFLQAKIVIARRRVNRQAFS